MASLLLVRLCLLSLTTDGLQSLDHLRMFARVGDYVTLPCGIPSIKHCSSVNWSRTGDIRSDTEVAMAPNMLSHGQVKDCPLVFDHLELNDARHYSCQSGKFSADVSLEILEINEGSTPEDGTIKLQCFLNTYIGLVTCNKRWIQIKWSTEDNAPLIGNRFHVRNPSECLSELTIDKKLTDHHRKWKCWLFQNGTLKATISHTTTVKDGVEEVFAAVGESASLSCGNISSLGSGGTGAFRVSKDSSLFIGKVSAAHAGDYRCSVSSSQQDISHKIRLHVLDVSPEYGPGGDNVTLTCVLTSTNQSHADLNLTWSGSSQNSWQSGSLSVSNTLRNKLFLPALPMTSEELTCMVHREGVLMASKKWCRVNSLQTPAWLALPLGLLVCITALGLHMYKKRKKNRRAVNEQSSIGMVTGDISETHVYNDIQDAKDEELHRQRQFQQEDAGFYDLLQPVNKN